MRGNARSAVKAKRVRPTCLCRGLDRPLEQCLAKRHRCRRVNLEDYLAAGRDYTEYIPVLLLLAFILDVTYLGVLGYSDRLICALGLSVVLPALAWRKIRATRPGYCYLSLVPGKLHNRALFTLGRFPELRRLAPFLPGNAIIRGKPGAVWHFPGRTAIASWKLCRGRGLAGYDDPLIGMFRTLEGTIHAEAMSSDLVQRHLDNMKETLDFSRYTLTDVEADLLANCGLQVTRVPGLNHRHAAAKRIEDHFLHKVLPPHFGHRNTVMFQKGEKTLKWFNFPGRKVQLFNPTLTARDVGRYRQDYLPGMPKGLNSDFLFLHDAGHYLSPSDVALMFARYPTLDKIGFTAILPAEATERAPSLFPDLYSLEYRPGSYSFSLKGQHEDSYEQPYSTLEWLKCNEIVCKSGMIRHSVERIESVYAHHLFICTRQRAPISEGYRGFPVPKAYELPAPERPLARYHRWVPKELYDSSIRHLRHLKTSTFENAMAKIRQEIKGRHRWTTNQAYDLCAENLTKAASVRVESLDVDPGPLESLRRMYYSLAESLLYQVAVFLLLACSLEVLHLLYGTGWTERTFHVWAGTESTGPARTVALFCYLVLWILWLFYFWRWLLAYVSLGCLVATGLLWFFSALQRSTALFTPGDFRQPVAGTPDALQLVKHAWVHYFSDRDSHPRAITAFLVLWPLLIFHLYTVLRIYLSGRAIRSRRLGEHLDPVELKLGWQTGPSHYDVTRLNRWVRVPVDASPEDMEVAEVFEEVEPPEELDAKHPSFGLLEEMHLRRCRDCPQHTTGTNDHLCVAGFPKKGDDFCHHCAEYYHEVREAPATTLGSAQGSYERSDPTASAEVVRLEVSGPFPEAMHYRSRVPGSSRALVPTTCGVEALAASMGCDLENIKRIVSELPDSMYSSPITSRQLDVRTLVYVANQLGRSTRIETAAGPWIVGPEDDLDVVIHHDGMHFVSLEAPQARETTARAQRISERMKAALSSYAPSLRSGRKHWEFKYTNETPLPTTEKFLSNFKSFLHKAGIVAPRLNFVRYIPNPHRAKFLARDIKNNHSGKLYSMQGRGDVPRTYARQLDALVGKFCKFDNRPAVDLCVVYGMPGCGKSFPLQKWIAKTSIPFKVSCPTVENRQDWSSGLSEENKWRAGTYETNLLKSGSLLIVDEVSQLPPGYIDLALVADPTIRTVIVLGDHTQGLRYERDPEATTTDLDHEVDYLLPALREYHCYTYRLFKELADLLCVLTANPEPGFIKRVNYPPKDLPVISAMRKDVDMLLDTGVRAFSAVTVQGKSFNTPVCVDFNSAMAAKIPQNTAHAVLTRSKKGIFLIGLSSSNYAAASHKDLWNVVLSGRRKPFEQIFADRFEGLDVKMLKKPYRSWKASNSPALYVDEGLPALPEESEEVPTVQETTMPTLREIIDDKPKAPAREVNYSEPTVVLDPLPEPMPAAMPVEPREISNRHNNMSHPIPYSEQGTNSGCSVGVMRCGCWSVPSPAGNLAFDEAGAKAHMRRFADTPSIGVWRRKTTQTPDLTRAQFGGRSYFDAPIDLRLGFAEVHSEEVPEVRPVEMPPPDNLPEVHLLPATSSYPALLIDKHSGDRDVIYKGKRTRQFMANDTKVGSAETMAPRHQPAKDESLWQMTIDKRLRFRSPDQNQKDLLSREWLGKKLFEAYHSASGTDPAMDYPFDEQLYINQIEVNDLNKLSKGTQNLLVNNAFKSDPDWRFTFVRIFIKTQHKVSTSTLGSLPKAGQGIANFNDRVVLFYGPMVRYMGIKDDEARPPNHYYHAGKSTADMDTWCKANIPVSVGEFTENDFTAFDQSQTGEALAFELLKLRQRNIPEHIVEQYRSDKLGLTCQLGSLQTMRFSGEAGTWRFNTDFNYAISSLKYGLGPSDVMMMSGDDSVICGRYSETRFWRKYSRAFTVVAKTQFVARASFCSYLVTHAGCIKEPIPLSAKILIAVEQGTIDRVAYSLMSEHSATYQKKDLLNAFLTGDELEAVDFINRYMRAHLNAGFLKKIRTGTYGSYVTSFLQELDRGSSASSLLLGYYRLFTRADQLRFKNLLSALGVPVY